MYLLLFLVLLIPTTVGAFPTNAVLDGFGAADNTSPPNANWTNDVFTGGSSANCEAQSNGITSATSGTEADCYWNAASFGPNVEAYATLVSFVTPFHAVSVRLVNIGANTTDGYLVYIDGTGNTLDMWRLDNGVQTKIGSGVTIDPAAGDKFGISAIGSQICSWYKTSAGSWTQQECATDATYSAAGRIGFSTNTSNAAAAVDDFGGGTLPSTANQSPMILQ